MANGKGIDKNALKIAIVVIALLCVAFSIIYLGLDISKSRYGKFDDRKVEYINAHKPIYVDDYVDEYGNRALLIDPRLTDTLEIEYASMTFEKITTLEARKQNGKNVIRNMKNGWTYKVMLYFQFVGENEGRYYDFVVYELRQPYATYCLRVSFVNEELDLHKDVEMKLRNNEYSQGYILSWQDRKQHVTGRIELYTKEQLEERPWLKGLEL